MLQLSLQHRQPAEAGAHGRLRPLLNFLRKIWKGRSTRGRSTLQRAFDAAPTAPPVTAQTDNGFFPLSRWIFMPSLSLKRCRVTKRLLEAQIWRWWRLGEPELKRSRRRPLSVSEEPPPPPVWSRALASPGRTLAGTGICPWRGGSRRLEPQLRAQKGVAIGQC